MVRRGSTVRVRQRASKCCCLARRNLRASRVRDGYILGLAGTRGHARRLAAQPETCSRHSIASTHPKSSCKAEVGVACSDATLTPSSLERRSSGFPPRLISNASLSGRRRSRVRLSSLTLVHSDVGLGPRHTDVRSSVAMCRRVRCTAARRRGDFAEVRSLLAEEIVCHEPGDGRLLARPPRLPPTCSP
jgi:hypothetical protein